jgi:CyaY protein
MTDPEYLDLAEAALAAIEQGCDRINDATDADIDNQRVGGMITITFPNKSQLIVNLQPPLHEIWLAARSGGYHYRHDGSAWVDTKTGEELFANLSREATAQGCEPLQFSAALA